MQDLISRWAAIDAIGKASDELYENIKKGATFPQRQWFDGMAQAQSILENLPSAQPEIVRKPVVGYEGYYEVDNCGRVYALDRIVHVEDHGRIYDKQLKGGIIKQHMHSNGYKVVCLTKDGKSKTVFVHRIVAMAFLPNPENLPCINHKDEDKTNNFMDNIEWCTYKYNNAYGSKPKKHSKRMTGRKQTDEQKVRRSESLKRYWANKRVERRTDEQAVSE